MSATASETDISRGQLVSGDLITDLALRKDDRDEFEYTGVAARIADLACEGEPPLSIAVFGPWGSGKSSLAELVRRQLASRTQNPSFVQYDAWRYGGGALKRNFIAHAARELCVPDDPAHQEFHRGLFENRRVAEISQLHLRRALWTAIGLLPAFLALALVAAGLLGLADLMGVYNHAFARAKSFVLGGTLVVGSVLFVVKFLADAGRIEIDQSRPSEDDQFSATFQRLIEKVTADPQPATVPERTSQAIRAGWRWLLGRKRLGAPLRAFWRPPAASQPIVRSDRVVFFVDELDRCREQDVVATLNAIRTFLDVKRCVFIVAADRDVIERALRNVDQATPLNKIDPYYSTASAFLDKIFHHQLVLPPMRGRRLSVWARDLARRRPGGLWAELAAADPRSLASLDEVLYRLIPTHVRSPRRVKVLLNAYATNVRVAQTRLEHAWPDLALEIARLTALQVEFPNFAADLRQEPRLPRFVLSDEGRPDSKLIGELVARWRSPDSDPDGFIEADEPTKHSTSRTDVDDEDDATDDDVEAAAEKERNGSASDLAAAKHQRALQLRRYLERTRETPDIPRSLLYLNTTGAEVGIEDPELGEIVERDATDSPETILDEVRSRSATERQAVARLLASMVEEVLGPERENVMTALMGVVEELGEDAAPVAATVSQCLDTYCAAGDLDPEHLPGAIWIALAAEGEDSELADALLDEEELWLDEYRCRRVISIASQFSDAMLVTLARRLVTAVAASPYIAFFAAKELDDRTGPVVLNEDVISAFLDALAKEAGDEAPPVDEDDNRTVDGAAALIAAAREPQRERHLVALIQQLFSVDGDVARRALDVAREETLETLAPEDRSTVVLLAWAHAEREDWGEWGEALARTPAARPVPVAERVLRMIVFAACSDEPGNLEVLSGLVSVVAPWLAEDDLDCEALLRAVRARIDEFPWHGKETAARERAALHRFLARLAEAVPRLAQDIEQVRHLDVFRTLTTAPVAETDHLEAAREMIDLLEHESIDTLADALPDWRAEEDGGVKVRWLLTELFIAHRVSHPDLNLIRSKAKDVYAVADRTLTGDARQVSPISAAVAALWLEADPPPRQVVSLLRALRSRRSSVVDEALAEWASRAGLSDRRRQERNTSVVRAVLRLKRHAPTWIEALARGGLFEVAIVKTASEILLDQSTTAPQRKAVASTLAAMRPHSKQARTEIARLGRQLLDRRLYLNDLETVVALMPALHDEYSGVDKLERSVNAWLKDKKQKPTRDQALTLLRVGVRIEEDSLSAKTLKAVRNGIEQVVDLGGFFARRFSR